MILHRQIDRLNSTLDDKTFTRRAVLSVWNSVVFAQTPTERLLTDFSLKFLEQNLDPTQFFRSHRSAIVQLDRIESIAPWGAGTYRLLFNRATNLGVPLARSRAADLKALIPWSANMFDQP